MVGRLVFEKGFHLALDALAPIARRDGNVRFVVAGTGTAEAELKTQARQLRLSRYGSLIGWAGDDLLHSLYRVADLCIAPSIYEPFGLVVLEAMASGCLYVVADTGGLREVVLRSTGPRWHGTLSAFTTRCWHASRRCPVGFDGAIWSGVSHRTRCPRRPRL